MSPARRHEFWLGAVQYRLCHAFEAKVHGGRVLSGSEAVSLIRALLHSSAAAALREACADLTCSLGVAQRTDAQIFRWLSLELGGDGLGAGLARLALVEVADEAIDRNEQMARQVPPTQAQRVAKELARQIVGDLAHRGRGYRVVVAAEQRDVSDRSSYEVLNAREAAAVLAQIAEEPTRAPAQKALLVQASALVTSSPGGKPSEALVLLRRARIFERPASQSATTPSQLRKKEKTEWIELRFVDHAGEPIANQAYALKLADGSTRQGTLDENGMAYLGDVLAGICDISFPNFSPRVA